MTGQEIRDLCKKKNITFIPHHACAICGVNTGWYLFGRWPPYEVAYSSSCNCGFGDHAEPDTWDSIADWLTDKDGKLRNEYKLFFGINDSEQ